MIARRKTLTKPSSPMVPCVGTPATNGQKSSGPIPIIITTGRPLRSITQDGLQAFVAANDPAAVFQRGGQLVRVRCTERGAVVEPLTEAMLRGVLERAAQFTRITSERLIPMPPPLHVVRDLAALPTWPGIPELAEITEAPVLWPDGTVLNRPGYDPETGLLYVPAPGFEMPPVPKTPTDEQVVEARRIIEETLEGFAFSDDASFANAVAALVTAVVRPAIAGPAPFLVLDSPGLGEGKSSLASTVAVVATGRPAAAIAEAEDEAEWRKRITSALASGASIVLIDNVTRRIDSAALAALATAEEWADRPLGANRLVRFPVRLFLMLTGTNVRIAGDLRRRIVWIRLDSKTMRPWERRFTRPDLMTWVREHRGQVVWAVLVLAMRWFALGCPQVDVSGMGNFGAWARTLAGILSAGGITGFLSNQSAAMEELDEAHLGWEGFLRCWRDELREEPITVGHLIEQVRTSDTLRTAIPDDLSDCFGERPNARRIGVALRKRLSLRFAADGLRIERTGDGRTGARWHVIVDGDLAALVDRLAEGGDGRHRYALDLARELDYPGLSIAPGRSVAAGEREWVTFLVQVTGEDLDRAIAALQTRDGETL